MGFDDHDLDEDAFGEKKGSIVAAFDAFPKAKPQYLTRTSSGGKWTIAMLVISFILVCTEFSRWWGGSESHSYSVDYRGIGQSLQINVDLVVAMKCEDVHMNVQDASGDRILAGMMLKHEKTRWEQWVDADGVHQLGQDKEGRVVTDGTHDEGFGEEHVHDIVGNARIKKFAKTPRLRGQEDACRVFGSLEVNKVQGDFHITARGHGYQEFGSHLDHNSFNFSHIISELSFGPYYPNLQNPLDRVISTTHNHFYKFQYFLSVVPTIYRLAKPLSYSEIHTNQYAVTSQHSLVSERSVPGIFVKYDIEPVMMLVQEDHRAGILRFLLKVVNVVSGVLVAGHWGFRLTDWIGEVVGRRKKGYSEGVLNGRAHELLV